MERKWGRERAMWKEMRDETRELQEERRKAGKDGGGPVRIIFNAVIFKLFRKTPQ